MAKCVLHCIAKYLNGCGLEDGLVETNIFGIKVLESVISASNYTRVLRGIKILPLAIETVKWQAFWASHNDGNFQEATIHIQLMQDAMCSKDRKKCTELFKISHITTKELQNEFRQFSTHCSENQNFVTS